MGSNKWFRETDEDIISRCSAARDIGGMLTHAGFILVGFPQFSLPVSLAILVVTFGVSVAQAIVTISNRRYFFTVSLSFQAEPSLIYR